VSSRSWLVTLAAAGVLAGSGCDGDNHDAQAPDDGCTDDYPNRLQNVGRLADFFATCSTDDGASILLTNTTSGVVLVVRAGDLLNVPEMAVSRSSSPSFKETVVNDSVPLSCSSTSGPCLLTPNSRLTARTSRGLVRLLADVDLAATATATAANSLAGYVQGKLTTRASKFAGGITACARSAGAAATEHQFIGDAVRDSVQASGDCGSLIAGVARELNEQPPPPIDAGEQVLRHAGSYTADLRRDFSVYEAIRVISKIHR
jgi:hypothetical protein